MTTNLPFRTLKRATDSAIRKRPQPKRAHLVQSSTFTTSLRLRVEEDVDPADRPRWQQTPKAMVAPVPTNFKREHMTFKVNESQEKLDEVYVRILGAGGDRLLPEEVKWLAITHKSFDHGRRGFNDRLAYFGKRVVDLQTSLALLTAPDPEIQNSSNPQLDEFGRTPFQHHSLNGLDKLTESAKAKELDKSRLAQLAESYGLAKVIRWKPKNTRNLAGSGIDVVLAHTIYAIVGAITLQNGGEIGNRIVKDRVLNPLGL
ncbi:hypothetical protein EV356DRAFT_534355 [Viridothelium virens]|uniref:RNase III domain-containing protein n=1 Tax=Viridothelium virens TaxID=1048519 RepID=A0A6A6H569_VIRVR|nr:hypothetical protein EV356DRAFT_534355 [Viridothelium virens]